MQASASAGGCRRRETRPGRDPTSRGPATRARRRCSPRPGRQSVLDGTAAAVRAFPPGVAPGHVTTGLTRLPLCGPLPDCRTPQQRAIADARAAPMIGPTGPAARARRLILRMRRVIGRPVLPAARMVSGTHGARALMALAFPGGYCVGNGHRMMALANRSRPRWQSSFTRGDACLTRFVRRGATGTFRDHGCARR